MDDDKYDDRDLVDEVPTTTSIGWSILLPQDVQVAIPRQNELLLEVPTVPLLLRVLMISKGSGSINSDIDSSPSSLVLMFVSFTTR